MRKNKISIIISKSINEVFEFTTNPKYTSLWIPSIQEEIATEYPPKIGTLYKNHDKNSDWDFYKVLEYEQDKIFFLSDLQENYQVRYTYKKLNENQTKMEYFEWMKEGQLKNPFSQNILQNLKETLEKIK